MGAKPDLSELKERLAGTNMTAEQVEELGMMMTLKDARIKVLEKTQQKIDLIVASALIADHYDEDTFLTLQTAIEEGRVEMEEVNDRLTKFFEGVFARLTEEERERYKSMLAPPPRAEGK